MKKFLSSLLIGAFVFGVGAADVQIASAASYPPSISGKNKISQRNDKTQQHKTSQRNNNKFTQIPPPPPPLSRIPQSKMPQPPPR